MQFRNYIRFITLVLLASSLKAQHYQFSQFYAAPTYLNPAFTGANACARVTSNYRSQWSGIPGAFTTYQVSLDHFFRPMKSGMGIQFFNDRAGLGGLTTTQVNLLYAYETRISKKVMGRAGISLGTIQRRVDLASFVFGDQIEKGEGSHSSEGFGDTRINYFDVGSGILVYSNTYWQGISFAHMNSPNQSLLNGNSSLPAEFKLHGGYKYILDEDETTNKLYTAGHSVTFAYNYKKQNKFNQLDLGVYYTKNLFMAGCWYRGLPFFHPEKSYQNNDAVIFLFGMAIGKYKIGYSYDLTVSRLTNLSSKGSQELSMSYQFCTPKKLSKKRRAVLISCPKF